MLNEDLNNLHWKNKLEDADGLSAETLSDKNATWEKLHNRLRENSKPKKVVWYWAAAACLLMAVVIPLMLVHKNENTVVKNNIQKNKRSKSELKQAKPLKNGATAAISTGTGEKKRTIKIKIKNYNNTIADTNKEPSETNNNNQITANKIILSVPSTDSIVVTTAGIMHAKKKLKVVHINEIGDPVEALSEITHKTDLHLFQLKLATQEVYDKSSVASNTTGIPIIKLKTSRN